MPKMTERKRNESAVLVQNRIPLLDSLEFDVIFPLEVDYLKNISFTRIGTKAEKKYVYRAVLENHQRNGIIPDVSILLFDALGIQVGMTTLTKENSASETHYIDLKPGESRAYSSQIYLTRNAEPKYFLVEVK